MGWDDAEKPLAHRNFDIARHRTLFPLNTDTSSQSIDSLINTTFRSAPECILRSGAPLS